MSKIIKDSKQLNEVRDAALDKKAKQADGEHHTIRICMGASCIASGSMQIKMRCKPNSINRALANGFRWLKPAAKVPVRPVPCW